MGSNFLQTEWLRAPHPPRTSCRWSGLGLPILSVPSRLQPRIVCACLTFQSLARPEVPTALSQFEAVTRTPVEWNGASFPHGSCLMTMKSRIEPSKGFASSVVRPGAYRSPCSVGLGSLLLGGCLSLPQPSAAKLPAPVYPALRTGCRAAGSRVARQPCPLQLGLSGEAGRRDSRHDCRDFSLFNSEKDKITTRTLKARMD